MHWKICDPLQLANSQRKQTKTQYSDRFSLKLRVNQGLCSQMENHHPAALRNIPKARVGGVCDGSHPREGYRHGILLKVFAWVKLGNFCFGRHHKSGEQCKAWGTGLPPWPGSPRRHMKEQRIVPMSMPLWLETHAITFLWGFGYFSVWVFSSGGSIALTHLRCTLSPNSHLPASGP